MHFGALIEGTYHATFPGMSRTERISVDPNVCHGKACTRGSSVMLSVVPENLAAGLSPAEIARSYSSLQLDDITEARRVLAEPIPISASTRKPIALPPSGTELI